MWEFRFLLETKLHEGKRPFTTVHLDWTEAVLSRMSSHNQRVYRTRTSQVSRNEGLEEVAQNELPLPQLQTRLIIFRLAASDHSGRIVFRTCRSLLANQSGYLTECQPVFDQPCRNHSARASESGSSPLLAVAPSTFFISPYG